MSARTLAMLLASATLSLVAAADEVHRYRVRVAADLADLAVEACPAGRPAALAAGHEAAGVNLLAMTDANGRALSPDGGRVALKGDGCIHYRVDLAALAQLNPRYGGIGAGNVAAPIDAWLWRPRGQAATATEVRFELPPGIQVSVPWAHLDGGEARYRIPPSPASDDAISVFGHFRACTLPVAGARLRVALLTGRYPAHGDELLRWVRGAAASVTHVYGRFPNPAPQVVLVPTARGRFDRGEPVPFGHVIRNGGEAVQFFVNQRRRLADFAADWTATHEFAHLLIPYVRSDEKWISEGLASYYQNVLMARAGSYEPARAWRKLIEGFRRGEDSVPQLSLENAMPLGGWDGIMKTYWGGAAIFLMADVSLRQDRAAGQSLDTVLERLSACCLPSRRTWSGSRLFRRLDELAGRRVFMPLYERYRAARAFPPYAETLAALGVGLGATRTTFDDDAPLAAIRRAIMAARAAAAAQPGAPLCDAGGPHSS